MDFDNSRASKLVRRDEDKTGLEVCDGKCRKEIASLRAEISAMKKLLDTYCPHDNPGEAQPMDHEVTEAEKHDLTATGDVKTACSAAEAGPHPAVLNDLILRQLGSYLSLKDLRECRLVCKTWNAAISVTLQMRPTYLNLEKDLSTEVEYISNLISSLESDRKFPFPGVLFPDCLLYEHILEQPEEEEELEIMKRFLSECSHLFKRLRLPCAHMNFDVATLFVKGLATYFSHVEVLDMGTLIHMKQFGSMEPTELSLLRSDLEHLHFPELKKLILPSLIGNDYGYQVLVGGIIGAAPNLQCMEGFSTGLITALGSSGRMDLIFTMQFEDCDAFRWERFVEVALTPPHRLSRLEVDKITNCKVDPELPKARRNALITVLKANRDTLKSLTLRDLGSHLEGLPCFPNLKSLRIIGNEKRCSEAYRLFPSNMSNLFPSLTTVKVEFTDKYSNDPTVSVEMAKALKFFLWDEPLPTVTSLSIHFPLEKHGIRFLGRIFPNVTKLSIDWEGCFRKNREEYRREDLWSIWTVPFELQRLEIHRLNLWSHEDFSLDSFLTGIPEPVCRNLRDQEFSQLSVDPRFYDALRGHPSMLNLKKSLRELVISVDYPPRASDDAMKEAYEQQTVSSLATSYGINLMKPISVHLAYDHRNFYSSSFKKFLAPIEGDNVVLFHEAFRNPRFDGSLLP